MKLRRFTEAGVVAVRKALYEVEKAGDLAPATALLSREDLTEDIPALADIDLDETRTFDTTFAFCEYFHSLIKDHSPLRYRTDSGFWTWLAVVYLPQLVKVDDKGGISVGAVERVVYDGKNFSRAYRHLMSHAYYLFRAYERDPELTYAALIHPINVVGDLPDKILSNQTVSQNPALMNAINALYFDAEKGEAKKGSGGDRAGSIRRFIYVTDQLAMTRDMFDLADSQELLAILPEEFKSFQSI